MYVCMYVCMCVCISIYVCIYVCIFDCAKMADEVKDQLEQTLNLVVCRTEKNSNMKKDLKQKILATVSTLRALFVKLKVSGDKKTS